MMCLFWSFYTSWWFVAIDFDSCGLCRSKTGTVLSHRLHQAIACFRTRENRKKAHYVPLGSPAHFRTQPLPVMCLIVLHMYVTFSNMLWLMPWQKDHWQLCIGSASKVDHRLKTCAELLLMTNVYCLHIYDPYQCSSGPHFCTHLLTHPSWLGSSPCGSFQTRGMFGQYQKKKEPKATQFSASTWPKIYGATSFVHSEPGPAHHKAHNPDLILLVDSRNDWPVADVISAGPAIGNHDMIYKLGVH